MPPTINRIRQVGKIDSFLDNSRLAMVRDLQGQILPESHRENVSDSRPTATAIISPASSSHHRNRKKRLPSRHTRRDDSAAVPVPVVTVTVVPHPPPPYTPPIPLRASRLPPVPAPLSTGTTNHTTNPLPSPTSPAAAKIALIIAIIFLSLLLILAIIREMARRNRNNRRRKEASGQEQGVFRPRIPKFPNVLGGKVARDMEGLSWNMENQAFEERELATRTEFKDRSWDEPMLSAHTSGFRNDDKSVVEDPGIEGPDSCVQALPWLVPTHRTSCPPALDNFSAHPQNENEDIDQTRMRALSMLDFSFSPSSFLASIKEESMEYIMQDTNDEGSGKLSNSNSGPALCELVDTASATDHISDVLDAGSISVGTSRPTPGRTRQGSDASQKTDTDISTEDADTDKCFSDTGSRSSSNSSVASTFPDYDDNESGMGEGEEAEVFELRRVTDSMEVKKGVLLALTAATPGENELPQMPKVVVRPASTSSEVLCRHSTVKSSPALSYDGPDANETSAEAQLLQPTLLTKSSSSSLRTLESVASGASIDLNDFPPPPASKHSPSFITFTLCTDARFVTPLS